MLLNRKVGGRAMKIIYDFLLPVFLLSLRSYLLPVFPFKFFFVQKTIGL